MKKKTTLKVFMVDDDPIFIKTYEKSILDSAYYPTTVKTFNSGEDCLKNLHENPDIILLDYYLSSNGQKRINGIDTLKKIKKVNSKAKVIMLSGQDELAVAVNSIKYGAFDYIVKNETSYIKTQNSINNIVYRKILEAESKDHKMWFGIASMLLLVLAISALAISFWNPIH